MSVLEFLGEILPWPASRRLEDVQICKSRLILQARALRAGTRFDPWERMLAHACERGAAEWEHWLLTNYAEPPAERELTAHSGLTLAQRSGDWALVGEILRTWKTKGEGHKRFYREAVKAHQRHWPAFERELPELQRLASTLNERPSTDDAHKLLALTESYAERGGVGFLLHARADAHQVLGEQMQSQGAEFAACIANPLQWRLAWCWFVRNAMALAPISPSAEARKRALAWYDQSGDVHAGALFLANTAQAINGPPSETLIASSLTLPRSLQSDAMLVFVVENVAWALVSRGDFVRAEEILADAIKRVPTHHGLIELHEATALLRRPTSASLVAITDQFAKQAKIDVPQSLAA